MARRGLAGLDLLLIGVAIVALCRTLGAVHPSDASFTDSSTSNLSGGADTVTRYLRLFSQPTDPDGLTGYYQRQGSSPAQPAATASAFTLSANLGGVGEGADLVASRIFTLKVPPAPLPRGLTTITARATLVADAGTGSQPLRQARIANLDGSGGAASRSLTPGQKVQFNVRVRTVGLTVDRQYTPHVLVTVTYTGFTTTFYQLDVPVKLYTGTGPGPN